MENQKVSIELTVAQWNVVMQGVGSMPFAQVAEIITIIKTQAEAQIQSSTIQSESQPS